MEADDEVKGNNNSYDFGARIYDPRVGRWLSTDAMERKYPSLSPYNYAGNMPTIAIDPNGKNHVIVIDKVNKTITIRTVLYTDNAKATERANDAAMSMNNTSAEFQGRITIDGNDPIVGTFNVVYDVSVQQVENAQESANADPAGNSFGIVRKITSEDGTVRASGRVFQNSSGDYNKILVTKRSRKRTAIHEIFHILGVGHNAGEGKTNHLMNIRLKPKNRTNVDKHYVGSIIEKSLEDNSLDAKVERMEKANQHGTSNDRTITVIEESDNGSKSNQIQSLEIRGKIKSLSHVNENGESSKVSGEGSIKITE